MTALDHIDLHIAKGEMVSMVGPSGSGKSTLLRTLSGALSMRAGSVALDGRELKSWSALERARSSSWVRQGRILPSCSWVPEQPR